MIFKIIVLFSLLIPGIADAYCNPYILGAGAVTGGGGESGGNACSACPSDTDGGDVFCEDFEGSYVCTVPAWTETFSGSSTLNEEASHPGSLACTDKGSYALYINRGNQPCNINRTFTAETLFYTNFYFYLDSESVSAWGLIGVAEFEGSGSETFSVLIEEQGDTTYRIRFRYWNGSTYDTAQTTLALDTWYRVSAKWQSGTNFSGWIDGVEVVNDSTGIGTRSVDKSYYGDSGTSSGAHESYYDIMKADDDTLPGACPE